MTTATKTPKVKPLTLGQKSALKKAQKQAELDSQRLLMVLAPHLCLAEMASNPNYENWGGVSYRVHFGAQMVQFFHDGELRALFTDALNALQDMYIHTCENDGYWELTPAQRALLGMALNHTDELYAACNDAELNVAHAQCVDIAFDFEFLLHQHYVLGSP